MQIPEIKTIASIGPIGTPVDLGHIISLLKAYNKENNSNQEAAIDNVILRLNLINEKEKREAAKKKG